MQKTARSGKIRKTLWGRGLSSGWTGGAKGAVTALTGFEKISMHMSGAVEFSINNGNMQTSKMYTLSFISPYHCVSFTQKSRLLGQSFAFSESFVHYAYESSRFHKDFPFLWNDQNVYFL